MLILYYMNFFFVKNFAKIIVEAIEKAQMDSCGIK